MEDLKDFEGVIGNPQNPYQQNYSDTCAIKSQQLILNEFGVPVTEDQCVQYSYDHGWYDNDGTGTSFSDIGNLLGDAGIPYSRTEGANIYDIANELAQGHKVIVGVDSAELWSDSIWEWLKDIFFGDTPDHAIIVAGIDMTDPDNPMVIVTDPGTGDAGKPYPLDQFMDAWKDSNSFMVSTDVATPEATKDMIANNLNGHLEEVAGVDYDTFTQFQDYSHQIDYSSDLTARLYIIFKQYPTMELNSLDEALSLYSSEMPSYTPTEILAIDFVDPFNFDYNALSNIEWLDGQIIDTPDHYASYSFEDLQSDFIFAQQQYHNCIDWGLPASAEVWQHQMDLIQDYAQHNNIDLGIPT